MADPQQIVQILRDELALQTRHGALLEAQEQALLACDRTQFARLEQEHAQMLTVLEVQDAARRAALTDEAGEPLTFSALKDLLPTGSLNRLEEGLKRTLERVQTLTRRNQILIQNELEYFAFTLDLFVEAGRNADKGYGPGRPGRQRTNRLLLDRRA